jgi:hypothetical protein
MAEEGWDDSLCVRPAILEEETQLRGSGNNTFVTQREDGTSELVVGLGKYLNFEEGAALQGLQ